MDRSYVSLADFAEGFAARDEHLPPWVPPGARAPLSLDQPSVRARVEDVLDTVVALQRADWLQDGVFVGPTSMPEVYDVVLHAARTLGIAVPPAVVAGCAMSSQGIFGTDDRAFLHLSTYFFGPASEGERRFLAGRLCGFAASRLVTANTLYALLVDHGGLRQVARKGVGPVLEVVLAPLSLGVRLTLSRWHRYAEVAADRAGLLCCDDVDAAGRALLRLALGGDRGITPDAYLAQLDALRSDDSPGRFAQLLADRPWTHKRIKALHAFHRSVAFDRAGGTAPQQDLLDDEALEATTRRLLGVTS
jgi:hypothetical protein